MSSFQGHEDGMDMEEDMTSFERDSNAENRGPQAMEGVEEMSETVKVPLSPESTTTLYSIGRSNSFTEDMVFGSANEGGGALPTFGLPPQDTNQAAVPTTPTKMMSAMNSQALIPGGSTPTLQGRFETDFDIAYTIGKGTFGAVYCARHKVSQVNYAVKKSRRAFNNNVDRNNMLKEVETMAEMFAVDTGAEVTHVVQYMGAWIEDDRVFLQMELCDMSVESMMQQERIPPQEIYKILRHMILALKFVHSKEMCHLDIKPGNILRKADNYKLSDFGLALHIDKQGSIRSGSNSDNTVEEGDSRYMPIEMLSWAPVDNLTKCDIFSLGITAFELVTHTPVPPHGDEWQLLRSDHWPMPEGVPEEMADFLSATMLRDPPRRPTAQQCLDHYNFLKSDIEKELSFQKRAVQALKDKLFGGKPDKPALRRHHSVI